MKMEKKINIMICKSTFCRRFSTHVAKVTAIRKTGLTDAIRNSKDTAVSADFTSILPIFHLVIVCGRTLVITAELLKISCNTVNRIVCLIRQSLNYQKKRHHELLRKFKQLPPALQEVRYLDETFYTIAEKTVI